MHSIVWVSYKPFIWRRFTTFPLHFAYLAQVLCDYSNAGVCHWGQFEMQCLLLSQQWGHLNESLAGTCLSALPHFIWIEKITLKAENRLKERDILQTSQVTLSGRWNVLFSHSFSIFSGSDISLLPIFIYFSDGATNYKNTMAERFGI